MLYSLHSYWTTIRITAPLTRFWPSPCNRSPGTCGYFGYEIWGLCIPNVLVIIDEVIEDKLKMLSCFTFANQAIDYVHTTKGLNMYRSRLLGAGECRYAECFFELPRTEFIELVDRIRAVEAGSQKAPGEIPVAKS